MPSTTLLKRVRFNSFSDFVHAGWLVVIINEWTNRHNRAVYTRENKPRLTPATAYIRGERNHLYECGLHRMRTAGINGSRLGPRPDQSNDDVVCFGASERAKKRNDWLWSGKSPYFTLSFSFQLTFRSSLELGCWETCAETSSKSSSAISQSSESKEMFRRWMRWRKWTKFPALSWSRSFSRQCSARLSAMKVWYIIENRACAAIVHSFSKPRKTYECIYTNTFTSKLSCGLDKLSPKFLGQDKPRLELAVGWISREHRFCTIYTGCSRLMQAAARESRVLLSLV